MNSVELAFMCQVLLWLVVLGVFLSSGQTSIFHPMGIYLGFHLLVFILRPFLVIFLGFHSVWDYTGFNPEPEDLIRTLAVSSVGLVVLAVSCLLIGRTRLGFPEGPLPSFSREQGYALVVITIMLVPLIAYSIYAAGGDTGAVRAANGVMTLTKTTGYITDAQFMLAPLLCLWLVKTRFHWLNLVPILLYLAYRTWCGWARWTIILFFITLVFQYCWYHRLRWLPAWMLGAAALVFMLFNVIGHNRDMLKTLLSEGTLVVNQDGTGPGMTVEEKRQQQLDTLDFANFDYLTVVDAIIPKRTERYSYGAQYLQLFTEPIPRILWPGKPAGAPVAFFSLNQYVNFTGLTVSLVGDGWTSGGWIGVVITMALAGAILGLAHRSFWARSSLPLPSMLYVSFLGIAPNWFRDGGISVFKFLMFIWLPLLLLPVVAWFLKGRVVPVRSMLLRPGERLRVVENATNRASSGPSPSRTPIKIQ